MFVSQDRDKLQRQHLNDTVEELRRFNARRKLKSAVLAVAGGISMDPQYGADSDSSKFLGTILRVSGESSMHNSKCSSSHSWF